MAWTLLPYSPGENVQEADRFAELVAAVNERKAAIVAVFGGVETPISAPAHIHQQVWWNNIQTWLESAIHCFVVNYDDEGNRILPEDYNGAVDDAEWQGGSTYTFPHWTMEAVFTSMGITGWTRHPRGGAVTTGKAQVRDYLIPQLFNEIMAVLDRMELMALDNPKWYHWDEDESEWVEGLVVTGPPNEYFYNQWYGPESGWKNSLADAKSQAEGAWESVIGESYPNPDIFQRWAGLSKRIYPYPPVDEENPVYQWIGTAGHVAPSADATVGLGVELNNRPSGGTVHVFWSGRATTEPTWNENSVFDPAGTPIQEDALELLASDGFAPGGAQTFVVEVEVEGDSPPSFPTWPDEPPAPTTEYSTSSAAGWMERSRVALVQWDFIYLTPPL